MSNEPTPTSSPAPTDGNALPGADELTAYAHTALALGAISLSDLDLRLTIEEFRRGMAIVKPLMEFELPDRLDLAGTYRP